MSPRSRPAALRRAVPPRFATPVTMDDDQPEPPMALAPPDDKGPTTNVTPFPATYLITPVSVEDLDMLWDWVRSDPPGTTGFLGVRHPNSQSFFKHVSETIVQEQTGKAWFRSISHAGTLVGFVALILKDAVGALSLYLTPSARDQVLAITADVIAAIPVGVTLVVATTDPDVIAAFVAQRFEKHTVLTRAAQGGVPSIR